MDRCSRALALTGVLVLAGCGGGGGGTRPAPPPAPPPPPPPPPATCTDPAADNTGGPLPCSYPDASDHLVPTRVDRAHAQGVRGEGVRVGLLDTPRAIDPYAPLAGKIAYYRDYTGTQSLPGDPAYGHGDTVGAVLAGRPLGGFPGGVAPGAELYWTTACNHLGCLPQWHADGVADLAGHGVRIINASVGTGRPLDTSWMEIWRGAYQPVVTHDILLVVATANFGSAQPQPLAMLPAHAPEFLDTMISVTGVVIDRDTGEPGDLHPVASACGDAAQWCMAGPMPVRFPSVLDPATTELGAGTSFAAPVVSGVAALVAGVYPWMSASNLQTTLLTTATDLGEPGVDDRFGWGMVNAEKAILGPAQFIADFHADVPEGTWEFGNPITGVGGLTKSGAGSLRLSQHNTYVGDTRISAGELELTGSVTGDVFNGATLLSRGGHIGGNYFTSTDSVTSIEVGMGLEVEGVAHLAGGLHLLAPADGSDPGAIERILGAGGLEGQFDAVSVASGFFYEAVLGYTDTEVTANLTRISAMGAATAMGLAAPALAGAHQTDVLLDHLERAGSSRVGATLQAARRMMAAGSAGHAAASLTSLAGEVHGTLRVLELEHALGESGLLADRIAELPRTEPGNGALSLTSARAGTLRSGGYTSADVAGSSQLVGGYASVSDTVRTGFALSGSTLQGQLGGLAGDARARRTGASAFARLDHGRLYASAIVGLDRTRADTRRSILLNERLEPVHDDRHDHVWHGRLEAGWAATPTLSPFAAFGLLQHHQGRIDEVGADGLGLAAAADRHRIGFGETGVRISRRFASDARLGVVVAGRWIVAGHDPDFRAAFAGVREAEFSVAGQQLPGFSARAGVQFASAERNGWRVVAEAGSEVARCGVRDASASLGLGWRF